MSKMVMVEDLAPGDVLADEVLSMNGRVLLGRDIMLTPRHITLLKSWEIQSVFLEGEEPVSAAEEMLPEESGQTDPMAAFREDYRQIVDDLEESFTIIQQHQLVPVTKMTENAMKIDASLVKNLESLGYLLTDMGDSSQLISGHSVRVAFFADLIARQLHWEDADVQGVTLAGLMHDVGNLLVKPTLLLCKEAHLAETASLLQRARMLPPSVIMGIVQHREYVNGTGFPNKTQGSQIHPYAKVIAIADAFYNMAYNLQGVNPFTTMDMLKHEMYVKFDPLICETFLSSMKDHLMLSRVLLSDNQTAEVVFFNKMNYHDPVLKTADNKIINLAERRDLKIVRLIASDLLKG